MIRTSEMVSDAMLGGCNLALQFRPESGFKRLKVRISALIVWWSDPFILASI